MEILHVYAGVENAGLWSCFGSDAAVEAEGGVGVTLRMRGPFMDINDTK